MELRVAHGKGWGEGARRQERSCVRLLDTSHTGERVRRRVGHSARLFSLLQLRVELVLHHR
jgi:hypothetical protein